MADAPIELGKDGAFDLDACASMPVGDAPDSDDDNSSSATADPAFVKEANTAGARATSAAARAAEKAARMNAASAAAAMEEEVHRQEMEAFAAAQEQKAAVAAPPVPPVAPSPLKPPVQCPRLPAPTTAQFEALLSEVLDECPEDADMRAQIEDSLRTTWAEPKAKEMLAKLAASGEGAARQAAAVADRWDADEARRVLFFPTANDAGCYAALIFGPKPSGRAMVRVKCHSFPRRCCAQPLSPLQAQPCHGRMVPFHHISSLC